MGFNKLLADLAGEPVLAKTISAFERCDVVGEIIVVSGGETLDAAAGWLGEQRWTKLKAVVEGGAERHLSVRNGLAALAEDCEYVAVHDGARPLVRPDLIAQSFELAKTSGATACAHPITDTVKRATPDGVVSGAVDREGLWGMETPQTFRLDLLTTCYDAVIARGELVTDEVSAVEAEGYPVQLVANHQPNPKITFEADLAIAARLLS